MENTAVNEGKTMAIISYITVIGLIIAYFMNKGKDNSFANFHIKQSFRLFIFGILLSIALFALIMVTKMASLNILSWIPFVFIILGVMNAANGNEKKLPIIG